MIKFYYNGIKDNNGKLQSCHYSASQLIGHPAETITIYARGYAPFSSGIQAAFKVENDSEYQTDYVVEDIIRVEPSHPLYESVKMAYTAQQMHRERVAARRAA